MYGPPLAIFSGAALLLMILNTFVLCCVCCKIVYPADAGGGTLTKWNFFKRGNVQPQDQVKVRAGLLYSTRLCKSGLCVAVVNHAFSGRRTWCRWTGRTKRLMFDD
jgi:hypothetical protein